MRASNILSKLSQEFSREKLLRRCANLDVCLRSLNLLLLSVNRIACGNIYNVTYKQYTLRLIASIFEPVPIQTDTSMNSWLQGWKA